MKRFAWLAAAAALAVPASAAGRDFRIVNHARFPAAEVQRIERAIVREHPKAHFLTAAQVNGKSYSRVWPIWLESPTWLAKWHQAHEFAFVGYSYYPDNVPPWGYGIVRAAHEYWPVASRLSSVVGRLLR